MVTKMTRFIVFCLLLFIVGCSDAYPFLWPSSFRRTTTTTTTTTQTGHPHANHGYSGGSTQVVGQHLGSHLHTRPASVSSYLPHRPLPPLVMGAQHHHHHPVGVTTPHVHLHGGAISGTVGAGHRHHYHAHSQHHHHHHPHAARSLHSHTHA